MYFLSYIINTAFRIFYWLIIIRAVLTWIAPNVHDPNWRKLLTLLYKLTEPILAPIRRYIPMNNLAIDISPIIALIALRILNSFFISLIRYLAMDLGL
ncbi:YggT family protein [Natronospora cellulosivora (SeqCode)]